MDDRDPVLRALMSGPVTLQPDERKWIESLVATLAHPVAQRDGVIAGLKPEVCGPLHIVLLRGLAALDEDYESAVDFGSDG